MPAKSHEYGIESSSAARAARAGDTCDRNIRTDARAAWLADVGEEVADQYDFVFYLSAGQDESSTWQEFGEMKFATKEDVTDEFGPPDPALPNWNNTRYVEWTSWQASANIWPNAGRRQLDPGRELRACPSTPTSSATSSASATTTTTRTRVPPAAPTAGPGRCSTAARSTAPAARTAGG